MTWMDLTVATAAATIGATIVMITLRFIDRRSARFVTANDSTATGPVFLFNDKIMIDATPDALAMIAPHVRHMNDYDAVIHVLSPHFPKLRETLAEDISTPVQIAGAKAADIWLDAQQKDGILRLAVKGHNDADGQTASDVIEIDIRMSELEMLRDMAQHSPQMIWHEDHDGTLLWANHMYLTFCDQRQNTSDNIATADTWPSEPLFPNLHEALANRDSTVRRLSVTLPKKRAEHWFDVTSIKRHDGSLHFATDANAVVRANHERHHFVQTLGKTFADLSIGLAIFNKRRELTMFNPALVDMTNLPVDFLSQRPTLDTVLDRLRETRMLPEPKNYTTWRDHFTALEVAAKNGHYTEIWNLPEGQTYRVTGRPHPDGAFAFLFEDISAEISLTRRFRTDIETGQAVLDALADPIAVFSSGGTMVMSNAAYNRLWDESPAGVITPFDLQSASKNWQSKCAPTPVWAELHRFIHILGPRKPWSDRVILDDGRHLRCHAQPISGGMTMVRFSLAPPQMPVMRKLAAADPALLAAKR
ncbi:PAS-domain containing protein [Yoonia sp.]|uniref:PAS-domain containing protein n=1 Tax=Yoonia sp. TaxID=2212373 RepID=UPI0019DCB547|nr:PAS-domain containing protein [Yoonia sp.]MBE0413885.1 PAS-domain containing protein [Yoonia sp.]